MDRPHAAPPVVAVMVSRQPGASFPDALAAFAAQDYPNLSLLVVSGVPDPGAPDPGEIVAEVAPSAYVRISEATTYGAAANDVLRSVQGAAFLLFCHDDVAPEPRAVRRMVDEAMRSNAGIVSPKVLDWDRPERILEVGLAVDKSGAAEPRAEPGELDQAQHDAVRDVFAVSSTCILIRADLFADLGGFDPGMDDAGAGVDLCWRAQVAGARVMVVPASRVRHRRRERSEAELDYLERRNHLRTTLKCYSAFHLIRVIPQAGLLAMGEVMLALLTGKRAEAAAVIRAWTWNLTHLSDTRERRTRVQRSRTVGDAELRRLHVRGSVRAVTYVQRRLRRREMGVGPDDPASGPAASVRPRGRSDVANRPTRVWLALAGMLGVAVALGSRDLILGSLPAVGEFTPWPGVGDLLGSYLQGWRTTGLGADAAPPPAFAALALGGIVTLGSTALLQQVLVVATWPVAAAGIWRVSRALGSTFARLATLVAYLAVPLPYDSVARGRWSGLVAYAAAPFLFSALVRVVGLAPFARPGARGGSAGAAGLRTVLGLGVGTAAVAMFVPSVAVALIVTAVGLVLGSLLSGGAAAALRGLGAVAAAVVLAAVLLMPWTLELAGPGGLSTMTGVGTDPSRATSLFALFRFEIGPMGAAPLGWALLVAASLALAIGKGWRLAWAVRLWMVIITTVATYWAGDRGWSPLRFESPDVMLAFAAVAVALTVGLGATAFEVDLSRYRFGWRQVATVVGGVGLVVATVPVLAGSLDGRWQLASDDVARSLSWMDEQGETFKALWVGDPVALPLDGWHLQDGVAFGTTRGGQPSFTDLLPGKMSPATLELRTALEAARDRETARLGSLLAPMGIRYLVLPERLSAASTSVATTEASDVGSARALPPQPFPIPPAVTGSLRSQIDLRLLPSDPGVTVYENTAWAPTPAVIPADLAGGPVPTELGTGADLRATQAVMTRDGALSYVGEVPGAALVLLTEAPSENWSLRVEGVSARRASALAVANVFTVPAQGGDAELSYRTSLAHYGAVLGQVGLWITVLVLLARTRRRTQARSHQRGGATIAATAAAAQAPRGPLGRAPGPQTPGPRPPVSRPPASAPESQPAPPPTPVPTDPDLSYWRGPGAGR